MTLRLIVFTRDGETETETFLSTGGKVTKYLDDGLVEFVTSCGWTAIVHESSLKPFKNNETEPTSN